RGPRSPRAGARSCEIELRRRAVALQDLRHRDRAVGVLVGLEDGDQRSPDGHRGAVEGVHKLRAALGAGAAIETPRLEVGAVRARGDFTEAGLARHPGLTVE